ncbi:MAG: outer membrane protein assembly factor BamA [Ignavibacteria bacterium]|jgi:outer membrane protein insertion porin family
MSKKKTKMWKNSPNKWLSYSLLFFLFLLNINYAQLNRSAYKILDITVEGNVSTDERTIIANTGLKKGDEIEVPGDATITAIKRLWALGIFKDVQLVIEKKIDRGIFLVIKIVEYPRLEEALFEGNDEIDEDDIHDEITIVRGQTLKPQDISKIKRNIKKLYDEEGLLNAEITHDTFSFFEADTTSDEIIVTWRNDENLTDQYETFYEYDPAFDFRRISKIKERKLLLFRIKEGDRIEVRKIDFVGNDAYDDGDLKGEFEETSEHSWWKFWSSSTFIKDKYEEDKKLLYAFYKKNGYRDFEILGDTLILSDDKKEVDIFISVSEGPQYMIRNIIWEGNTIHTDEQLSERLGFQKGDIYNDELLNQNLYFNEKQSDVSSLYQDQGYLAFNLNLYEEKVAPDSLDLRIRVNENSRFKIGKVNIGGNDKTKDKVIRRELYSIPGDYYSRNGIFRSIQQLANLNYFNVEKLYQEGVNPRPMNDSTVAVDFSVEEKSSDYLNASIGYSGSFGMSGSIGVTLTNFSITEPFQLGGGQVLDFNWTFGVGNLYRTFRLGFTEPWFLDTPTLVGFDVFDTRQRYVYDLRQIGGTVKVGRRLTWPDNYFNIQGFFKFNFNDVIDGGSFYVEGLSRQYTVGATLSRNNIDNPIFPSTGSSFAISGEISGGPLLPGNVDYFKIIFNADWYKRLFNSNRLTLYTNSTFGYINEIVDDTPIQPFEFFYMGGNGLVIATTPLRGYDDRSVGPVSSSGDILGGRVMVKYTSELRAALALEPIPIYVIAFAEGGNTFLNIKDADLFDLKRSAGFGARLLVQPVGLLGFDYGYGFDRLSVDGEQPQWEFHFQFGRGL